VAGLGNNIDIASNFEDHMPIEPDSPSKTHPVSEALAPQAEKSAAKNKLVSSGLASYAVSISVNAEPAVSEQKEIAPAPTIVREEEEEEDNQFKSLGDLEQIKTVLNSGMTPSYFRLLIFNSIYFILAWYVTMDYATHLIYAYACSSLVVAYNTAIEAILLLIALDFSKSGRTFTNITDGTTLPLPLQKSLRALALVVPMLAMIGAGTNHYAISSTEHPIADAEYTVGLKTPMPNSQEYSKKLELASTLTFYNPSTLRLLQSRADQAGLYQLGLRLADQRLFLTPNNNGARVEKGLTLISSLALTEQARLWFEQELRKTPQDGNLWSLKSRLESQTGNMGAALIAANEHVKFHKGEARAYNMRADIYEKLGMSEEANADRIKTIDLKKSVAAKSRQLI